MILKMKSILFATICTLILIIHPAFSQNSAEFNLHGKINIINNEIVESDEIVIALFQKDSLKYLTIPKSDGKFKISGLLKGKYLLSISHINIEDYTSNIDIDRDLSLGTIDLKLKSHQLVDVVVMASENAISSDFGKEKINPSKSLYGVSGKLTNLLEESNFISKDASGKILLRGSEDYIVLINNQAVSYGTENAKTILENIPVASIKNVEIITNQSGRYSSGNIGGIINVNLKNNVDPYISIQAIGSSLYEYGGQISTAYLNKKISLNTTIGYNKQKYNIKNDTERFDYITKTHYMQDDDNDRSLQNSSLMLDFYYKINNSNNLNVGLNYFNSQNDYNRTILNGADMFKSLSISEFNTYNPRVSYQYIAKNGSTLKMSYNIIWGNSMKDISFLFSDYANMKDDSRKIQDANIDISTKLPLSINANFGVQLNSQLYDYNQVEKTTNIFNYQSSIPAAYIDLKKSFTNFVMNAGVRNELHRRKIRSGIETNRYTNNVFLPFVSLKYIVNDKLSYSISYNKKYIPPTPNYLNPIIDNSDPFNARVGDIFLKPEIVDVIQLSASYKTHNSAFSMQPYWRNRSNTVQSLVFKDDENVIVKYSNVNKIFDYGIDLNYNLNILTSHSFIFRCNLLYIKYDDDGLYNEGLNGRFQLNYKYDISRIGLKTQAVYNVYLKQKIAQGYIAPYSYLSFYFSKSIFNKKGTLSLVLNDVFNSNVIKMHVDNDEFKRFVKRKYKTSYVEISLTYDLYRGKKESGKSKNSKLFHEDDF